MTKLILLTSPFFIISAICLSARHVNAARPSPTENYPNEMSLVGQDQLYMYWKLDNSTQITFEIQLKSPNYWLAFGLNNSNPANKADIFIAWMRNDSIGHFSDRTLSSQNILSIDNTTSWIPIDAFSQDGYLVLKVTRNIKVNCDGVVSADLDIITGMNKIVFAMGPSVDVNLATESLLVTPTLKSKDVQLLIPSSAQYNCPQKVVKGQFSSKPTAYYSFYEDLMDNGMYRLYWNYTDTVFTGEIHVKTSGWVGFGLSPNGGMTGADIAIGWISASGVANFTDRFATGKSMPMIDKKQDWKMLYSSYANGYTIFKFQRPILLCDSDDRKIEVNR